MYSTGNSLSNKAVLANLPSEVLWLYMALRPLILLLVALIIAGAGAFFVMRPAPTEIPSLSSSATTTPSAILEDSGQYYEITASYPEDIALAPDATAVAKASAEAMIDAWVKETVATFKSNASLDTLTEEDIRVQGLDQGRTYTLGMEYETYTGPATVSYLFELYEDTLGAHPNAYYRSFTFDSSSGRELRIADLFEGTTYLQTLSRISREKLIPHIAKMTDTTEEELDTEYIESGTTPDPNNFQVFYLTASDLTIVFPPYQVGPWVLGTQTVAIPRSELSAELKPPYR